MCNNNNTQWYMMWVGVDIFLYSITENDVWCNEITNVIFMNIITNENGKS